MSITYSYVLFQFDLSRVSQSVHVGAIIDRPLVSKCALDRAVFFATISTEIYLTGDAYGTAQKKTEPTDRVRLQYTKHLFYYHLHGQSQESVLDGCRGGHRPPEKCSVN